MASTFVPKTLVKRVRALRSIYIIWRLLELTAAMRIHERPYFRPPYGTHRCSFSSWSLEDEGAQTLAAETSSCCDYLGVLRCLAHVSRSRSKQMSTKNPAASKWLPSSLKHIFSCLWQHNPYVSSLKEKYRFLLYTMLNAPHRNLVQWRWRWVSVRRQKYFELNDPVRRNTVILDLPERQLKERKNCFLNEACLFWIGLLNWLVSQKSHTVWLADG